jgi:hypothetical protein
MKPIVNAVAPEIEKKIEIAKEEKSGHMSSGSGDQKKKSKKK